MVLEHVGKIADETGQEGPAAHPLPFNDWAPEASVQDGPLNR